MRIKTKLIAIYLIGAILSGVTILFVINSYASIRNDFSIVMNNPVKKLSALKKVEGSILRMVASTSEYGLLIAEKNEELHQKLGIHNYSTETFEELEEESEDSDVLAEDEEKELFAEGFENYQKAVSEYQNLVAASPNNQEDNFEEIKLRGDELIALCKEFVELKKNGAVGKVVLEKKEELEDSERTVLAAIEKSNLHQYEELSKKQQNVEETISSSTKNTIFISALAILFTVGGGYFFALRITKSIHKLQDVSNKIGQGTLDLEFEVNSKDEIKELADDFRRMMFQLKDSRDEILASKNFVENIFSSMAEMLFAVDDDGIIERVNESVLNQLGYEENEIVGKPISILNQQKTFLTDEEFEFMLANKVLIEVEKEFVSKNGKKIQVLISSSILHGKKAAAVVVAKDITKLKQDEQKLISYTQKLRQSNRELEDFAYVASHDLQEPLRKIQAFGDRLNKKCAANLSDEGRDYIHRMGDAASRMQRLINDLLTFSRVSTKAQPFEQVDIRKITDEVISDLEVRIEETNGQVEIGELPQIDADPVQIRQLMQNLIGNSLKFSQAGKSPIIRVYAQEFSDKSASFIIHGQNVETTGSSERMCQIVVQDNGIGFDEKYLGKIFTVFQRLHGRTEYEGSGVGLAVCRKIVERHRGTITAKSTEGEGSKFLIILPIKQTQEEILNYENRL